MHILENRMVYPAEVGTQSTGYLQVNTTAFTDGKAVPDVDVQISYTGMPDRVIEDVRTNMSGPS